MSLPMTEQERIAGTEQQSHSYTSDAVEARLRQAREQQLTQAKALEKELDATFLGMWIPRPGIQGNPAVYLGQDGTFFRILGTAEEVAGTDDPEDVQKKATHVITGRPEKHGNYAIRRFDLEQRIKDGILFYTPSGYLEKKPYKITSDPPLPGIQGPTPSPTK